MSTDDLPVQLPTFAHIATAKLYYCRLGDVVSASGFIEPGTFTMAVVQIDVTEPWKAKHAGISFVPKLLPTLHGNAQSCKLIMLCPLYSLTCTYCGTRPWLTQFTI